MIQFETAPNQKVVHERFGVHIDFAHRTFRWDSEANIKAHVHCVIIGFSAAENAKTKVIFDNQTDRTCRNCRTINAYLTDAPDVFVESCNKPLCDVPEMTTGNRPADGGHLIIEAEEYDDFIAREPGTLPSMQGTRSLLGLLNMLPKPCRAFPPLFTGLWVCCSFPTTLDRACWPVL